MDNSENDLAYRGRGHVQYHGKYYHRRASDEQKEFLVDFMSRNLAFANNASEVNLNSAAATKCGRAGLWHKLTNELNALPGAYKSVAKWKKCWVDLRINAKAKYKKLKDRTGEIESNVIFGKECLTDLDERILKIIASCSSRTRRSNLVQVRNWSQFEDAPMNFEKTDENKVGEIIEDFINIPENLAVKVEILEDTENDHQEEPISLNSTPRQDNSQQQSETPENISSDHIMSTQKTVRKRKRSTVYRRISNEIADLKATFLKELFQYKREKIEVERQKMHLEAEKMQFEKERFTFEKYSIAERLKIESKKVAALVRISSAINSVVGPAVFSVREELDEESEAEM